MKKLTLIILAVALVATAANADTHYLCWTAGYGDPHLFFGKIPGPGDHTTIDIIHQIPIPMNSDATTYDGENWWINVGNDIYCFDQNGDYVRSFPKEGGRDVDGLGWDGNYLWINDSDTYSKDIYGNDGPYPSFYSGGEALTVVGDKLLSGHEYYEEPPADAYIHVFDFYGNFLFWGAAVYGYHIAAFYSLAYHDGIVWATAFYDDGDYNTYSDIIGYYYDDVGYYWDTYAIVHDVGVQDMGVCDADFIDIAESSLGKIKAYFADKEK